MPDAFELGNPNTMPGMPGRRHASPVEIWAARAWNVFNEGRPFSIVYPLLVLLAGAVVGLAPDGSLLVALAGAGAVAIVLSRFAFALRGRALLWIAALAGVPLLEPWRAPGLLAGALAGYALFTVVVWGSVYYHLRTGAPWTNGLRFWRLVLTNSDPTSGNALEQLPKLVIALSAAPCSRRSRPPAQSPDRGGRGRDRRGARRACRPPIREAAAALSHANRHGPAPGLCSPGACT